MAALDRTDIRILGALQANASQSLRQLAAQVSRSPNARWHRIKRPERAAIISRRMANPDAAKVGAGLTAYVLVKAVEHSDQLFKAFTTTVLAIPEVMEFYRTSGDMDHVLKLQLADVGRYDAIYKCLTGYARRVSVNASFSVEAMKPATAISLSGTI